jgi:hypothetical protein
MDGDPLRFTGNDFRVRLESWQHFIDFLKGQKREHPRGTLMVWTPNFGNDKKAMYQFRFKLSPDIGKFGYTVLIGI